MVFTALLFCAGFGISPAFADSFLDREAPVPATSMWVVGEPPPAWSALKGDCVLLELTDPDELVCQGLASRTVEVVRRTKDRHLLPVSVAVGGGADDEKAREFAKRFGFTWSFGVDRKGETFFAFGAPTLPRWYLVAPDGRVMWEGSPGALDDATLSGFLDRARLWRPAEIAKTVRPAADLFVKGKFAAAAKKASEAVAEAAKRRKAGLPVEGEVEKDAALLSDGLASIARIRLAIADRLAKDRWSLEAKDMLEGVAAGFAGTEWEGKAKAALDALAADERAVWEILAATRLREILASVKPASRRSVEKAVDDLGTFLSQFESAQVYERARAALERLRALLPAK